MKKEEEAVLELARKAREEEEKEAKKVSEEEQARIKKRVCHYFLSCLIKPLTIKVYFPDISPTFIDNAISSDLSNSLSSQDEKILESKKRRLQQKEKEKLEKEKRLNKLRSKVRILQLKFRQCLGFELESNYLMTYRIVKLIIITGCMLMLFSKKCLRLVEDGKWSVHVRTLTENYDLQGS